MTVSVQTRRSDVYLGNGSNDQFPFDFKVYSGAHLRVVVLSSSGTETDTTNFTVALNSDQDTDPGGTVTYPASGTKLQTGEKLVVIGDTPLSQTTDLTNGGGFAAQTVEDMVDKVVLMVQELVDVSARAVKVAETDDSGDVVLPAKSVRAGKLLGFDAVTGAPVALTTITGTLVTTFMATLLDDSDAATARATLGAIDPLYTSASGGDFIVFTSTAAGAESGLRLNQTQATSGMSLRLSNSGLNVQASLRGRGDGGATIYVGQTAGAASTSGLQAFDVNPDGNVVVGNSGTTGTRSVTIYNVNTGASAVSQLRVQSDAGSAFLQVASIAGGRAVTLYSNTGSALNIFTQDAQELRLGTNNNASRLVFGNTGGITCNENMTFASGVTPAAKNTAKAWVNFDGTGVGATRTIRDSFNVTSVADNGTGDYTVNFTNALSAGYAWSVSSGRGGALKGLTQEAPYQAAPTTTAFRMVVGYDIAGGDNDPGYVSAIFFGA